MLACGIFFHQWKKPSLQVPQFQSFSSYGHLGRSEPEPAWEKPKELEKPPVGAAKKAAAASSATESGQTGGAALSVRAAAKAREARTGPKKTKKKGIGYKSRMKELSSPDAQIDNDML